MFNFYRFYCFLFVCLTLFTDVSSQDIKQSEYEIQDKKITAEFHDALFSGKLGEADRTSNKFIALSKQSGNLKYQSKYYACQGFISYHRGKQNQSLQFFKKSEITAQKANSPKDEAIALYNMASQYIDLSKYDSAYLTCNACISLLVSVSDTSKLMTAQTMMGEIAIKQGNLSEAKKILYQTYYQATKLKYHKVVADAATQLGLIYIDYLNLYDSAISYFNRAAESYHKVDIHTAASSAYHNLGICYIQMNRPYAAYDNLIRALNYWRAKIELSGFELDTRIQIVIALSQMKDFAKATNQLDSIKSLIGKITPLSLERKKNYQLALYHFHKEQNNYKDALESYIKYSNYEDSVENQKAQQALIKLKAENQYKLEKTEKEHLQLKLKTTRISVYLFASISILLCLFLYLLSRNYRLKSFKTESEKALLYQKVKLYHSKNENAQNQEHGHIFVIDFYNPDVKIMLEKYWKIKLNSTDLSILSNINSNINITNKDLADAANVSTDGLRSALKKMYKAANIDAASENKKMALLIASFEISNKNNQFP
jgi:tetratricopeptide (TPR) repeat protein